MTDHVDKPLLSSTEERVFKTCRLQHHMQYVLGWDRKLHSRKLAFGINVHRGMETLYTSGSVREAILVMQDEASEQWEKILANPSDLNAAEQMVTFSKDRTLAEQMVTGYADWVVRSGVDVGWEVVDVEAGGIIEVPGAAHDLPVRLDMIQQNANGDYRVRDFKTAKSIPTDYAGYQISEQNGNYCLAMTAIYGVQPIEFSYTFLKKIIPSGRSKPPYYHEEILVRTGAELLRRAKDFIAISNEIADGYTVYASPDNCCGSWKNDWKQPCLLVHAGMDEDEALETLPNFHKKYAYDRYKDVISE